MAIDLSHTGVVSASTNRLARRADTILALLAEILLHNPILQRVKRDYCQPARRRQDAYRLGQNSLEGFQLLVNGDS